MNQKKKFWQSPNFILAVVLVLGGFFIGFPSEAATEAVSGLFTLIGGGGLVYKFFKNTPQGQVKPWLTDANFWNYLSVIIVSLLPTVGPAILPSLQEVTQALINGNLGGAIIGAVSLITIIVKIIQGRHNVIEPVRL